MFSGRGKSRTKLEQLFRQDHSDVYFNNDRLNDDLVSRIEGMEKEMHKHDQLRGRVALTSNCIPRYEGQTGT